VRRTYEGGGVNRRDPESRFTRKRDKTYFGYKAHLAVDEESGLVRRAELTPANVHDSHLAKRSSRVTSISNRATVLQLNPPAPKTGSTSVWPGLSVFYADRTRRRDSPQHFSV